MLLRYCLVLCHTIQYDTMPYPIVPDGRLLSMLKHYFSCDPAGLVQVSKQPKCPKVLKGECERCFRASGVRVPKRSLARCQTVFWGVSPGAKQGLHCARDLFGTLTPEARKHLWYSPLSTFGHFGCFDTCTRTAGRNTLVPLNTTWYPFNCFVQVSRGSI